MWPVFQVILVVHEHIINSSSNDVYFLAAKLWLSIYYLDVKKVCICKSVK